MSKVIIIGASTVGKTSLLNYLRKELNTPLEESDDILTAMNGGVYPDNKEYKNNILSPRMVQNILKRDQIIFFSNTDYFKPDDLRKAHRQNFTIILLTAPKEVMEIRNTHRVVNKGYDDLSQYFDEMLDYQEKIVGLGLVDEKIDATQPLQVVAKTLINALNQPGKIS